MKCQNRCADKWSLSSQARAVPLAKMPMGGSLEETEAPGREKRPGGTSTRAVKEMVQARMQVVGTDQPPGGWVGKVGGVRRGRLRQLKHFLPLATASPMLEPVPCSCAPSVQVGLRTGWRTSLAVGTGTIGPGDRV